MQTDTTFPSRSLLYRVATYCYEFIELMAFTVMTVLLITTFFVRHSIVVGPSMDRTLAAGEHLIISDFMYTPKPGDIVVFDDEDLHYTTPLVKRVIAVEGQTVRITHDSVFVDGVELDEPYVYTGDALPGYGYAPLEVTVPPGQLFVMGDHRNDSSDSRAFGTIDQRAVLGRVVLRVLPPRKFGRVE
ncbi:MAG: signal peptidase I [Eubacteriales bacterium]